MNKMPQKTIKGVIHFHSNYSYDGHDRIQDIVAFLRNRGCSFVFLTEHDDDFTDLKMERFVEDCEAASSEDFLVVPGIEFRCGNKVHILGLGLKNFFRCEDPKKVAEKINELEAKAIIAHPVRYADNVDYELIKLVDGVEIWNGNKDSRFLINPSVLTQFIFWKKVNPKLVAVCGGDHHNLAHYFPLEVRVPNCELTFQNIWEGIAGKGALLSGKFFKLSVRNIRKNNSCVKALWFLLENFRKIRRYF